MNEEKNNLTVIDTQNTAENEENKIVKIVNDQVKNQKEAQPETKNVEDEAEPVLMPDGAKQLLKELYLLRSYSGFEEPIRQGISNFLKKNNIPFVNLNGNILGFNYPGAPLFSAHMDMVNTENYKLKCDEYSLSSDHVFTLDKKACIRLYRDKEKKHQTSLGADDKNGIWTILALLSTGRKINFAFCHSEETGGTGSRQIIDDKECAEFIKSCPYGIIIDRRNAGDIIGYENKYCLALDDRLEQFAKDLDYPFKCTSGSVSDADRFSTLIECVNLSCGYYCPHTSNEYTNLNELWTTFCFCCDIVDHFKYTPLSHSRIKAMKGSSYSSNSYCGRSTNHYGYHTGNYSGVSSGATSSTIINGKSTVKTDEKKISETNREKEKTTMRSWRGTTKRCMDGTPGNTSTNCMDAMDELSYICDMAVENDGYLEASLGAYIIPLYSLSTIPKNISIRDELCWLRCRGCQEHKILSKTSIDSTFDCSKDGIYQIDWEAKIFGICTRCKTLVDITEQVWEYIC